MVLLMEGNIDSFQELERHLLLLCDGRLLRRSHRRGDGDVSADCQQRLFL
jgi:hypothetical protein